MNKIYSLILITCLLLSGPVLAGEGRYKFSSDSNEKRFQAFIHSTRCMLCQNQSVAESNSMFSEDMKSWLFEAIESGDTDYEIKQALIERFGDSVFYEPPFQMNTYLLWGLPVLFMLIGVFVIARRRTS